MDKLIDLLSKPEQANIVMQSIANYIAYVYPGIVSIYFYNFLEAKTTQNTQAFLVKSFAISYIYNILLINLGKNIDVLESVIVYNAVLVIIACIFPYLWHRLKHAEWFAKVCIFLRIYTSITSVPFDLLTDNDESYTCVKVYLKDEPCVYVGYVKEYEYEGEDKYLILSGYKKYLITSKMKEKLITNNDAEALREKVFIKYGDIKIIEKIAEERAQKEIYGN